MQTVLVSRVDWWRTYLSNCEERHNNFSKLIRGNRIAENCVLAMIRGLRQALTGIGCLQANESGPTVEEPCREEIAHYGHVYYDEREVHITLLQLSLQKTTRSACGCV